MTEPLDLDALAALEKAATPGPWQVLVDDYPTSPVLVWIIAPTNGQIAEMYADTNDPAFIAAARNALPRLLALARASERLAALVEKHQWRFQARYQELWCQECDAVKPEHTPDCELAAALAAYRAAGVGPAHE